MKIQISAVDVLHDEAKTFIGAERIFQWLDSREKKKEK